MSGKNKTTFEQMIRMDIRYAETRSPGLDLAIMLKTVPVLAFQAVEMVRRKRQGNTAPARAGRTTPAALPETFFYEFVLIREDSSHGY